MAQGLSFIFDAQKGETPQSIAQKRALVQQILGTSAAPKTFGEGLSAIGDGIVANVTGRRADNAQAAGEASADPIKQQIIASLTGQGAAAPQTSAAPGGQGVPAVAPQAGADWLNYTNTGATRNQPLAPELVNAMSFLPDLGVSMDVFSGGQEAEGPNRVGSHRHDHGDAGDVFFSKDGRRLDWSNPDDLPVYEEIVRRGKAAGVTGFGAGDGYMQPGSMHLGFGAPAVWGAGGSGANAPDWLRNAYSGGQTAPSERQSGATQVAQNSPQQNDIPMDILIKAMSNPFLDEGTKAIATQEFQRQRQMQDPAYQQQMQAGQLGIEKSQLELDAMRNPQKKPIEVGGVLLDPNTMEPIFDSRQPADNGFTLSPGQQRFDAQGKPIASAQPEPGFRQLSPQEVTQANLDPQKGWQLAPTGEIKQIGGGGTSVTVNNSDGAPGLGKLSTDFGYVLDPQTGQPKIDPATGLPTAAAVPGSPAAIAAQQAAAQVDAKGVTAGRYGNVVVEDIDRALDTLAKDPTWTTGLLGQAMGNFKGSSADRLNNLLDTVKSNAGFDRLQAMRDASPTGGALGAVSENENKLLQSAIGSLETSNSEDLAYNLKRVQRIYDEIINGPKATQPGQSQANPNVVDFSDYFK